MLNSGEPRVETVMLWGHARGLYVLTLTEMWERFSYYGMRALLIFYLIQKLSLTDAAAFSLYGNYTALVFVSPLLGGSLADRYLGPRRAVLLGGLLMIAGHLGLACHELAFAERSIQSFYLSLALIIIGVGLLKPNVSSMVGGLYPRDGYLRDSGFTVFVCGINVGAALAAVICGYVGQTYGWGYGFGVAAVGMSIGLSVFIRGKRYLPDARMPMWAEKCQTRIGDWSLVCAAVGCAIGAGWLLVQIGASLGYVIGTTFVAATGALLFHCSKQEHVEDRDRILAALLLMAIWIVSAAFIEQEGSSINLFTQRAIDLEVPLPSFIARLSGQHLLDTAALPTHFLRIRAAQLQATSSTLIIVGSPIFVWIWKVLAKHGVLPSAPKKFASSLLALSGGYALLAIGTMRPDTSGLVRLSWLLAFYLCIAIACLLIVPVGLAAVSKLVHPRIAGFMMGFWLLSNAVGNFLSARVATWSALDAGVSQHVATPAELSQYQTFFGSLAVAALILGVIVLASAPHIARLMHDRS